MTMIVFDFADIRSRMLGDDKPAPKSRDCIVLPADGREVVVGEVLIPASADPKFMLSREARARIEGNPTGRSWLKDRFRGAPEPQLVGIDPARPGSDRPGVVVHTRIPASEWRRISGPKLHIKAEDEIAKFDAAMRELKEAWNE